MRKVFLILILVSFLCTQYSYTSPKVPKYNLGSCKLSQIYFNDYEPEVFNKTNNLLRNLAQLNFAIGDKIILKGRVVDTNCQPFVDAKVLLWQANSYGKYVYNPLRENVDMELFINDLNSTFIGSGTAITNNKGEFTFITIYPGSIRKEGSHVNIRVELPAKNISYQTKVYLSKKVVQPKYDDMELNYYTFEKIIAPFEGNIYQFQVVVNNPKRVDADDD